MTKRILAILMMACMLVGILVACSNDGPLTDEEVQQIVIDACGASKRDISDIHSHISETADGQICFNVFITIKGVSYTYQVHAVTGEILSVKEGGHSH